MSVEAKGYAYPKSIYRFEFNLENKNLSRPKVREAVAHAIDPDVIIKHVFFG